MNSNHEQRVRELIAEGLTPAEARREARAERTEQQRLDQFGNRNSQSNVRIGLSFARLLTRIFK